MKKFLALILALLMIAACFVACNDGPVDPSKDSDSASDTTPPTDSTPSESDPIETDPVETEPISETPEMIQVGFAKECISPDGSYDVPLAGSGDGMQRLTTEVEDDIYASAVAFKDKNGKLALILSIDVLHITVEENQIYDNIMRQLKRIDGIDNSNVIISATHTHSSVDIFSSYRNIKATYLPFFYKSVRTAAEKAIADLSPAELYIGSAEMKNMAFVRRYFAEDGSFVGTQWPNDKDPVRHETEADTNMQIVKVVRNDKRDLVLTNWGVHLTMFNENKKVSSDFVAQFRDYMDDFADTDVVFFQGASGNTTPTTRLEGEAIADNYDAYGKLLAQKLYNALRKEDTLKKIDSCVEIKTQNEELELVYNHAKIAGLTEAQKQKAVQIAEDFYTARTTAGEANALAREAGFSSVYEAGTVRSLYKFHSLESGKSVGFWAFSVGELSFASAPYEMFCQTGMAIREGDKATTTFVITHANDSNGYIPSSDVWDNLGYESVTCPYEKGTAERIAELLISMVNKNYE